MRNITHGELPVAIQGLEKLAHHCDIPSVHLGVNVSKLAAQGKLIPKGNPLNENNVPVFSSDGTHPLKEGGDLYAEAIERSFRALMRKHHRPTAHKIIKPLYEDNWEDAKMFSPTDAAKFSKDWEKINPNKNDNLNQFKRWFPYVMK